MTTPTIWNSGDIKGPLAQTIILTAQANGRGGLYQVSHYSSSAPAPTGSNTIDIYYLWTERVTLVPESGGSVAGSPTNIFQFISPTLVRATETAFAIDTAPNTPISVMALTHNATLPTWQITTQLMPV